MPSTRSNRSNPPLDDVAEQAANWIVRLSTDHLTVADRASIQAEFEQWQQISPHHAETARKMLAIIEQTKQIRCIAHPASARAAVESSLTKTGKNIPIRKLGATLMLAIALALSTWLFFQQYSPTYLLADTRTAVGTWHTRSTAPRVVIVESNLRNRNVTIQ